MNLSSIVDVQITRETKTPTQKGFGTLLIVGTSDRFDAAERVRTYTSIEAVVADFTEGDPEIDLATMAFGQEVRPEKIMIGTVKAADSGDFSTALTAISQQNDDFYGIVITSKTESVILDVAAWVEARMKIFFAVTADAGVLAGTAGNVAEDLKAAGYDRTALFYSGAAATMHLGAAIAGGQLPKVPGSVTYKFKQAKGVTADNLTDTQITHLETNNVNHYLTVAGLNMLQQGKVASGEFIDVIIGADFITARMQENVYQTLSNAGKVPYTTQGIDMIRNKMEMVLKQARDVNQILASYLIMTPDIASISSLDKGTRTLPDMEFEGVLAGAVHKVKIRGRLVL